MYANVGISKNYTKTDYLHCCLLVAQKLHSFSWLLKFPSVLQKEKNKIMTAHDFEVIHVKGAVAKSTSISVQTDDAFA